MNWPEALTAVGVSWAIAWAIVALIRILAEATDLRNVSYKAPERGDTRM